MLLKHTPAEVVERSALTINPAKTCMPIGAMYASLGIHGCLPHSHGSQGCWRSGGYRSGPPRSVVMAMPSV